MKTYVLYIVENNDPRYISQRKCITALPPFISKASEEQELAHAEYSVKARYLTVLSCFLPPNLHTTPEGQILVLPHSGNEEIEASLGYVTSAKSQ